MKNIFVCLFIFLFSQIILAQLPEQNPLNNNKLPTIMPVSPVAAELGLYGNLPLNLSTGRLNKSINLYDIKVGKYSFPISLNYNFGGLTAEQDPSVAGLGWTLNVPGAITRQVNGLPDDADGGGYIFGSPTVAATNLKPYVEDFLNITPNGAYTVATKLNFFKMCSEGDIDSEPDKFNINGFNLSGSFFLNWDKTPKLASPFKDYIISIDQGTNQEIVKITVVGEDGVIYEFDVVEKSSTATTTNSGEGQVDPYGSAYYISKITFPDRSEEITFEYENYQFSKAATTWNIRLDEFYSKPYSPYDYIFTATGIEGKILKQINFPSGKVVFNNTLPNNLGGIPFLDSIEIKDNASPSTTTATYEFTYSKNATANNTQKLRTLSKIKKKSGSQVLPFYEFEYYGSLPNTPLISEAQDYWGFYNGFNNSNSHDILKDEDRGVHFASTRRGTLKKITYPTGGTSEIIYEQNNIPYIQDFSDADFYCGDIIYNNLPAEAISNATTSSATLDITIPTKQIIKLDLIAVAIGSGHISEASVTAINGGTLTPWRRCNYTPRYSVRVEIDQSQGTETDAEVAYFEVEAGTQLRLQASSFGIVNEYAWAKVSYYDPSQGILNTDVGGIRVKKTIDCANPTDCYSKKYTYTYSDAASTGVLMNFPQYLTGQTDLNSTPSMRYSFVKRMYSNVPLSTYNGSHILYKKVTVLENSNNNNGQVEHYFTGDANDPSLPPWIYKDPESWKKGNPKEQIVYKKQGNQLEIVSESENLYDEFNPYEDAILAYNNNMPYGFKAHRFTLDGLQPPTSLLQFNFGNNTLVPKFYAPIQSTEKQYLDSLEVSTTTTTDYDDTARVLQSTATTSTDLKTLITKYQYPKDFPNDPQMVALDTANRIGSPIQTKVYDKNGNNAERLLTTQKTTYSTFNGKLMPQFVKTLKGTGGSLETRVQFNDYDIYGNPVDVSQANGMRISYIWGYDGQFPVAKIENQIYSNIPSGLIDAVILHSNPVNGSEIPLLAALEGLRQGLPGTMVTTFTYKPLIGVSTITDPRGDKTTYHYDAFNRLEFIEDKNDKRLSKNEYHYKN